MSVNTSNDTRATIGGVAGASVLGAAGVYAGVRASESNALKGLFTATGATVGGRVTGVNPFVARWIGATQAHAGKLGEFGANHAGGVAHVAGKLAGGISDTAINTAAESITNLVKRPELSETAGTVAKTLRREAVGAVAADAVGNAVPKFARIAVPVALGAIGAAIGYALLSNALD